MMIRLIDPGLVPQNEHERQVQKIKKRGREDDDQFTMYAASGVRSLSQMINSRRTRRRVPRPLLLAFQFRIETTVTWYIVTSTMRRADTGVAWDVGILKVFLGMRRKAMSRLAPPIYWVLIIIIIIKDGMFRRREKVVRTAAL